MSILLLPVLFPVLLQGSAPTQADAPGCPLRPVEAVRLPDLNIARSGHSALMAGGEPTVFGGHTSGFVLTPTAEYFSNGTWHTLDMIYAHDGGFSVQLRSGQILIGGGYKDNLGISHSYEAELYNPGTHTFTGFGCLDRKRASSTTVELADGQVLIAGNWYADDGMELYDGHYTFSPLKGTVQSRYLPHLFRTDGGDVLVVGGYDNRGEALDTILVDRMTGEPFSSPVFSHWRPLHYDIPFHNAESFTGDETRGVFSYLLPVKNDSGQMAIVQVHDTVFSLLPTDFPVPVASPWGDIQWYSPVYTDRQRQRGYITGCDATGRQYALSIDYAQTPARLTLHHTPPLTDSKALTTPMLTDDGNLMLTGFKFPGPTFNFFPSPQVWLLQFNSPAPASSHSRLPWLWILVTLVLLALLAALLLRGTVARRLRGSPHPQKRRKAD